MKSQVPENSPVCSKRSSGPEIATNDTFLIPLSFANDVARCTMPLAISTPTTRRNVAREWKNKATDSTTHFQGDERPYHMRLNERKEFNFDEPARRSPKRRADPVRFMSVRM